MECSNEGDSTFASDVGYSIGDNVIETSEEEEAETVDNDPIPECEGLLRENWIERSVLAKDEYGNVIAEALIINCDPNDSIDGKGRLGDESLGILITDIINDLGDDRLIGKLVPWSVHSVYYNGVSMYDLGRRYETDRVEAELLKGGPRVGIRTYNSVARKQRAKVLRKKDITITNAAICTIASIDCCEWSCVQHFPRPLVKNLRAQMHWGKPKEKSALCLEVHKRIEVCPVTKRKYVMLESRRVCLKAWRLIYDIKDRTFHRNAWKTRHNIRPQDHGNLGRRKQRPATKQAIETLRVMLEGAADLMPNKPRTMKDTKERVGRKVLPTGTRWNVYLKKVNMINVQCQLKSISSSTLSRIKRTHFTEYVIKNRGDLFARCGTCDELKKLRDVHTSGTPEYLKVQARFDRHLFIQEAARSAYYGSRALSCYMPSRFLSIMHDKMDHSKTSSPCFAKKNKNTDGFMKLPVSVTGMLAHGHGDGKYAHYSLDRYPADSNATIGSVAKLLRDLEDAPVRSSRQLFCGSGTSSLYCAVLKGKSICYNSLQTAPRNLEVAKPLPPILHVQMDNAWKDNKSRFVKCFWSMLVAKRIVREVVVSYMIVGHTHDDIDASFGRWSMKLHTKDFLTIPDLMKSYMDLDKDVVIPHMIEEVPDFKAFIEPYIRKGPERLVGHTKGRQFRFYVADNGWPLMQYKMSCTSLAWLPEEGIKLWNEDENGQPLLPDGVPNAVKPRKMKNQVEVVKGINGFISYWNRLAQNDATGAVRRDVRKVIKYWKDVSSAVQECRNDGGENPSPIQNGFWPRTQQETSLDSMVVDNRFAREEYEEEEHYIGEAKGMPNRFYDAAIKTRKGYMVFLHAGDEGELTKPIWLGIALTDPEFDPTAERYHQIQVRWYTPIDRSKSELAKYHRWNTKATLKWEPHPTYMVPAWCNTDSICSSWKPCERDLSKVCAPLKTIKDAEKSISRYETTKRILQRHQ